MTPQRDPMTALEPLFRVLVENVVEQARAELATQPEREPWMTVEEAARYAKVHSKTILDWIASGGLAHGGSDRTIRVKASDVDGYLRRRAARVREEDSGPIEDRALAIAASIRKAG